MDIKKKRELLEAWENRHPEMGVISFRCSATDETFLATATDIPAKFNRIRFQLSAGNCPNKRLQELWEQYGEDAFDKIHWPVDQRAYPGCEPRPGSQR